MEAEKNANNMQRCWTHIIVKHKEFVRSNNLQVKIEITWEFGHSAHEHIELNT